MANQWDEDIIRNRNAKRLGKFSNEFHDFDSLDSFLEQLESSCQTVECLFENSSRNYGKQNIQ